MRKFLAAIIALLALCSTGARAQLFIDGRRAAYDSLTHVWLATLPEEQFGRTLTLSTSTGDRYQLALINGARAEDSITFHSVTASSRYMAAVALQDGSIVSGHVMFTALPVIELQGDFGYDYQQGLFLLSDPQYSQTDTLTARLKWRGASTNTPDKHKRNYKIKFDEDHKFFGLRNDNNWLLDAGQADVFRLRNLIASELWNDVATPPYYADREPKARSGIRGQVVELFLNNEYRGVYALTENVDRKQLRVKKCDAATGQVHGCVWKAKGNGMTAKMGGVTDYDNQSELWADFEVKYPDLSDNDSTDWSTLWRAIDFVANASDDDFLQHYEEYFDVPVTIDYFLFQNVVAAIDNDGKNIIWAVHDQQTDQRLTQAVWDLDATVGQPWLEKYDSAYSSPEIEINYPYYYIERLMLNLHHEPYCRAAVERYQQLRQTHFSTQNLMARYEKYYHLLHNSGADKREAQRWSGDSDVDGRTIDFPAQTQYICQWLQRRMPFLDDFFYSFNERLGVQTTRQAAPDRVYNLAGQQVSASGPRRPGIYIKNGRKYIQH